MSPLAALCFWPSFREGQISKKCMLILLILSNKLRKMISNLPGGVVIQKLKNFSRPDLYQETEPEPKPEPKQKGQQLELFE